MPREVGRWAERHPGRSSELGGGFAAACSQPGIIKKKISPEPELFA